MSQPSIQIREAQLDEDLNELKQVSNILKGAAERMRELGKTHWEVEQFELDLLEVSMRAHELFVVLIDNKVVGTFKIEPTDPMFWPEMVENDAVYVHKIAVSKEQRGQGLTREIVRWSKAYAAEKGRRYLRLDTDRARAGLRRLYESLGFSFHSYKKLDWIEVVRYEMEARP